MKNKLIIFLYNLSLKKALGFVLILSIFLSIPVISVLLQREKTLFSLAGNNVSTEEKVDESLIPYPIVGPEVYLVDKFYGKPGDSVLIYGKNFGEVRKESEIHLNKIALDRSLINFWSDGELEFVIPEGVGVFTVSVWINGNEASWFGKLNVFDSSVNDKLSIDIVNKVIMVSNPEYFLTIYSLNDVEYTVIGTDNHNFVKRSLPLDIVNSDILYIDLVIGGNSVPFIVE